MSLTLLPAVDVRDGKAVRLRQGESGSETDYGSPLEAARTWVESGAEWIHLVDLDAAFGTGNNRDQLRAIVKELGDKVNIEMSGGVRDDASLDAALEAGAARVNIGTAALENPDWTASVIKKYGDRVAVGLDVRGHTLAARGWVKEGGDLFETMAFLDSVGCSRYVVTDVARDGMMSGPNIDLLREVAERTDAKVTASGGISKLDDLRVQADKYTREGNLAEASKILYGEIPSIQKELAAAESADAESADASAANPADEPMVPDRVDADSVAEIVSDWTGIPVGRLMQGENEKLLHMEDYLGKRVIGQKEAIAAVSDAVRRSRAGISDPNRPTGSFLFLGPTGVGKTELAKALADFLFDDEKAMVRIDMSEYMEKASVSRLIGAAPGYVGYEQGGQLTEAVRRRPYSVVLFDEVEKANPEIFDVLLQVLDDGRLTDGQGRTVDFKNTILIMTSNLGSQFLVNEDMDADAKKKAVMDAVHMNFKPEFLNRLDDIVMFHPLTREELGGIVDIQVAGVSQRLTDRRITLDVTDSAREWLANTGYDPAYGARPLRRLVQTEVGDQLARMLLAGKVHDGDTVLVDQTGGEHLELSAWASDQIVSDNPDVSVDNVTEDK